VTGEYGDMLEAGILDPTKVTRLALQNASSVAGLLLTTEVMIADAPKDEAEHAHGPPGGGMGDTGMLAIGLLDPLIDTRGLAEMPGFSFDSWR
jgi:hypothetical protein